MVFATLTDDAVTQTSAANSIITPSIWRVRAMTFVTLQSRSHMIIPFITIWRIGTAACDKLVLRPFSWRHEVDVKGAQVRGTCSQTSKVVLDGFLLERSCSYPNTMATVLRRNVRAGGICKGALDCAKTISVLFHTERTRREYVRCASSTSMSDTRTHDYSTYVPLVQPCTMCVYMYV